MANGEETVWRLWIRSERKGIWVCLHSSSTDRDVLQRMVDNPYRYLPGVKNPALMQAKILPEGELPVTLSSKQKVQLRVAAAQLAEVLDALPEDERDGLLKQFEALIKSGELLKGEPSF